MFCSGGQFVLLATHSGWHSAGTHCPPAEFLGRCLLPAFRIAGDSSGPLGTTVRYVNLVQKFSPWGTQSGGHRVHCRFRARFIVSLSLDFSHVQGRG
jgi:hypothetical protein